MPIDYRSACSLVGSVWVAVMVGCAGVDPAEPGNRPQPLRVLVALTPDGLTVEIGDSVQMKAALPGSSPRWVWGVSNPAAASIDGRGLVRAIGPGEVTVRACTDEFSRTCGYAPLTVK